MTDAQITALAYELAECSKKHEFNECTVTVDEASYPRLCATFRAYLFRSKHKCAAGIFKLANGCTVHIKTGATGEDPYRIRRK